MEIEKKQQTIRRENIVQEITERAIRDTGSIDDTHGRSFWRFDFLIFSVSSCSVPDRTKRTVALKKIASKKDQYSSRRPRARIFLHVFGWQFYTTKTSQDPLIVEKNVSLSQRIIWVWSWFFLILSPLIAIFIEKTSCTYFSSRLWVTVLYHENVPRSVDRRKKRLSISANNLSLKLIFFYSLTIDSLR